MGVRPLVFGHTFRVGFANSSLESGSQRLCTSYTIEAVVDVGEGTHAPCDGHGTPRTLHFLFERMLERMPCVGGVGFDIFSWLFVGACVGICNPLIESLKVITTVQASTNDRHILAMRKFWSVGSNNRLMKQLINFSSNILSLGLHQW